MKNIREVEFKELPDGLVSIGVDSSVSTVAAVGSVFNGVAAGNVVSSTAKISNFICQYYNRCLISLHLSLIEQHSTFQFVPGVKHGSSFVRYELHFIGHSA